jgi:hypothetical protein
MSQLSQYESREIFLRKQNDTAMSEIMKYQIDQNGLEENVSHTQSENQILKNTINMQSKGKTNIKKQVISAREAAAAMASDAETLR